MPGFRTHFLFGKTSEEEFHLGKNFPCLREHPRVFWLGQQGPDIFFYDIPSLIRQKKNIGSEMHNHNVMAFFSALFESRQKIHLKSNLEIADAYIMGFIGHYTLDVTAHPYIQFRIQKRKFSDRPKYAHGNHVYLETDIDVALQEHYLHLPPSDFRPETTIAITRHESLVISKLLSNAIRITYPDMALSARQVRMVIRSTRLINRLIYDPHGRKKRLVRFIDERMYHHAYHSPIIATDGTSSYKDPLNLRHCPWKNPWDESVSSKQDFLELMDEARGIYMKRLNMYSRMMNYAGTNNLFSQKVQKASYYHRMNVLLSELGDYSYSKGVLIKK